ncbi:MAG: glycosyltransferase family 2 protein [Patescibacteria group bacterium]
MKKGISVVIIAGNEEKVIKRALDSASWADEIILVAANSTDKTVELAQKRVSRIVKTKDEYGRHFAKWRNLGLKTASFDWIFYLDADEVISGELKKELLKLVKGKTEEFGWYVVPRQNYFLGRRVRFGGSYPDYVKRFFKKAKLKRWQGRVHEEPLTNGPMGKLTGHLLHFTHTDLSSMLDKTIIWTDTEAEALYQSGHPPIVWWRIVRMMLTKFWERVIKQQSFRDGIVGWINSIFEVFNTFIIYAKLWEKQQKKL